LQEDPGVPAVPGTLGERAGDDYGLADLSSPTVIVSGMIAATPGQGGAAWAVLQYLLGLRRLGCDPFFVEPVDAAPTADTVGYARRVMDWFGLAGRWALLPADGADPIGVTRPELREVARRADLLLNIAGMLTDSDLLDRVPVRAYLDLDPVFTQLWHDVDGVDMRLDAHTHFATVADTVGKPSIPDCGREWIATLPPAVLDEWPPAERLERRALTTVGHWRSYGAIHHNGIQYGQKVHSLRPLIDLPRRLGVPLELALAIHPDEVRDLEALRDNGWICLDPAAVAETPDAYRDFVQGSWAEFGLAKSGYAVADSGWFSDRSACYLASGRPVLGQDTGFGRRLPVGEGLFTFATADDVLAAVEALEADYERNRAAAREIAVEYLDSDRVLGSLLERLAP
jgi:hypothetical protein